MKIITTLLFIFSSFPLLSTEPPMELWGGTFWNSASQIGYYAECAEWRIIENEGTICQSFKVKSFSASNDVEARNFNLTQIQGIHDNALSFEGVELYLKSLRKDVQAFLKLLLNRDMRGEIELVDDSDITSEALHMLLEYSLWPGKYRITPSFQAQGLMIVTKDLKVHIKFDYLAAEYDRIDLHRFRGTHIYTGHFFHDYPVVPVKVRKGLRLDSALHSMLQTSIVPLKDNHYLYIEKSKSFGEVIITSPDFKLKNFENVQATRIP